MSVADTIFSNNGTRRFIVDVIIDLASVKHCDGGVTNRGSNRLGDSNNGYRLYSTKSFSGKEIKIVQNSVYRRILVEIKPALLSVSGAIGQLRSYQHFLQYHRWYNGTRSERLSNPDLVILTIDATLAITPILVHVVIVGSTNRPSLRATTRNGRDDMIHTA
jgi:hypothetical protein